MRGCSSRPADRTALHVWQPHWRGHPNPDLKADKPRMHTYFECCERYDPESVLLWRELEQLIAGLGPRSAEADTRAISFATVPSPDDVHGRGQAVQCGMHGKGPAAYR